MKRYEAKHRGTPERLAETEVRRSVRAQERRLADLLVTGERADWALRS
jgi:hypothetical protein